MVERPKQRMEFYIASDQHQALRLRYKEFGIPIAEQIRRAIDQYLERQGKLSTKKGAKK